MGTTRMIACATVVEVEDACAFWQKEGARTWRLGPTNRGQLYGGGMGDDALWEKAGDAEFYVVIATTDDLQEVQAAPA